MAYEQERLNLRSCEKLVHENPQGPEVHCSIVALKLPLESESGNLICFLSPISTTVPPDQKIDSPYSK